MRLHEAMITSIDNPPTDLFLGLSLRDAVRFLTQSFREAGNAFAEDDALEILLSVTGVDRTGLILRGHEAIAPTDSAALTEYMNRRLAGEPVDHILGWREFYGRRFKVTSDVLSPRADTETLIRGALTRLKSVTSPEILDLGTGSGAIGLTLLAERDDAQLTATDLSDEALKIAQKNADHLISARRMVGGGTV